MAFSFAIPFQYLLLDLYSRQCPLCRWCIPLSGDNVGANNDNLPDFAFEYQRKNVDGLPSRFLERLL